MGWRRRWLPAALVAVGLFGGFALAQGRPPPPIGAPEPLAPLVRTAEVERRAVRLRVSAHGTVVPRTESELVPEVPGRVVAISPALAAGGFFEQGSVLLELDARDYESAARRARAGLRRAESQLSLAVSRRDRLRQLSGKGVASEDALDEAESAARVARAVREEAAAALDEARRNLERTRLRAPFAGRVREKWVDVGQYVSPGKPVARLYAVDYAEVRLPIRDAELAHLELPLDSRGAAGPPAEVPVTLRARFAGAEHTWHGRIVRTEGEIDPRSRMVHVVARVEDPYGGGAAEGGVPLAVGLFVDAEILGRTLDDALVLPRAALFDGDHVFTIEGDGTLRRRDVEVVHARGDEVVARGDLGAAARVCVSALADAIDGMRVRSLPADAT